MKDSQNLIESTLDDVISDCLIRISVHGTVHMLYSIREREEAKKR